MTNVDFDSERTAMLYSLGLLLKFNKIIKENCVYISLKFKHSIHISNIWYHQNNANDLRIFLPDWKHLLGNFYRLLENGFKYTNRLLVLDISTKININYFHYSQTVRLIGIKGLSEST